MKKIIVLCLALVLALSMVVLRQDNQKTQYYFRAKVIEAYEEYLLLEVFDTDSSNLSDGAKVEVSTAVVSADGCPAFVKNEYARILLARNIDDSLLGRLEALAVYKTDETGMVIAD